ncbi:MAG TPA: tRNA (adenosine(37)-N6)-dimethylallyltransferase MiaA [Bryobacteraceae bacterium]|nr:tRNA (adenosine(37)-N6)-dimethylallyltransferase MiaA [Bryobacteraceae bacterium]
MDQPLIILAGPTGAGKSALSVDLAGRFSGEIVNCDSLQLYRGFDIGTAKTPVHARRGIPHHLFDVLEPWEGSSAGEYARIARAAIAEISARGRLPAVAGGTGFYLRALLEGLPALPVQDRDLRARLAAREEKRPGALHRLLSRLDPEAALRIHARDTQKLIRAMEVRILTGSPPPPRSAAEPLRGYRVLKIGLDPDRAQLFARLDARVCTMFSSGLIEEVRALLAGGATGNEKPFESLGYKQALAYIRGSCSLDQAIELAQLQTRQYAKRQWTWFRRDTEMSWLRGFGDDPAVRQQCLAQVERFLDSPAPGGAAALETR